MHLAALNRGILLTPFHNMALIAPDAAESDIDYHTAVFRESVGQLVTGNWLFVSPNNQLPISNRQ